MDIPRDVLLQPVVVNHVCTYNVATPVNRGVRHLVRLPIVYAVTRRSVCVTLVVEPYITKAGLLPLVIDIVNGQELKVKHLNDILIVPVNSSLAVSVVVA
jgi:hypothetical protein